MKHIRWLTLILVVMMLSVPSAVRADVAPPAQPPGSNPGPETEGTQVRMVAETVLIEVLSGDSNRAKVTADFTMQNLSSNAEDMAVRFPTGADDGWFLGVQEIDDVHVFVNDFSVSARGITAVDPIGGSDTVPWIEFDVKFPPNQDVHIQVTYILNGTGYEPYIAYYYILHTGAGWKDTIGSADIIVRMPYDVNIYNVIFDEEIGWSTTTPGGIISGREVKWHFDNLEPDQSNDFQLSVIDPSVWKKVLNEQTNVKNNPNDGEAWGRLGKNYKEIMFYSKGYRNDVGGTELYQLAVDAYGKAVTLKPNDALWHAGFADLLAVHAYYENFGSTNASPDALRAMQEINRALELAPNDPKVKEIAEMIYFFFPDAVQQLENGYDYLWLTVTPKVSTPRPTLVKATSTPPATTPPLATETAVPAKEATPTSVPPTAKNPICGSVLSIPLVLIMVARRRRKHSGL